MTTDNTARIAAIQAILEAGATAVVVDGTTVTYDFAQLRIELRNLMATDTANAGRRPVAATLKLSGL